MSGLQHSSPDCSVESPCANCQKIASDGVRQLVEQIGMVFETAVVSSMLAAGFTDDMTPQITQFWAAYKTAKLAGIAKLFEPVPVPTQAAPPPPAAEEPALPPAAPQVVEVVPTPEPVQVVEVVDGPKVKAKRSRKKAAST